MPGKGIGLSAIAVGMAVKRAKEGRYSGGLGLQKKQRCRERKKKKYGAKAGGMRIKGIGKQIFLPLLRNPRQAKISKRKPKSLAK